jgi:hypothetical protein
MVALGFGFTTTVVMWILNLAILPRLGSWVLESNWTIWKEISWSLVVVFGISIGNFLFSKWMGFTANNWHTLLVFCKYTLAVGIFPITISILIKEIRLRHQFENSSDIINSEIHSIPEPTSSSVIVLNSENKDEKLELPMNSLVFAQAAGNYIEVHYQHDHLIKKYLLRNTLTSVTAYLEHTDSRFFRCHKSFLVNTHHVDRVSGNAQGYKLHLSGTDVLIPVSRQHNDNLTDRLTAHP